MNYWDEQMGEVMGDAMSTPFSLVLGRSGNLIQTLLRHNLVGQYRLWVFPLVIGSGKRLFSGGTIPSALKLVDSVVSTTGVVIGTYEPAGEIVTRSHPNPTPQPDTCEVVPQSPPIRSGIEKRQGVAGPSLPSDGRHHAEP